MVLKITKLEFVNKETDILRFIISKKLQQSILKNISQSGPAVNLNRSFPNKTHLRILQLYTKRNSDLENH